MPGTAQANQLNVLAFTNGTASHIWRFDPIAERMIKHTDHRMVVVPHNAWDDDIYGANIVILEMLTGPHIVDTCHNLGAKVIYEADDAVIDSYGRERANLQHIGPKWRKAAIETLRKVDAVTVSNKILADNYARFTDAPIFVLPIYMDFDLYKQAIDFEMPKRNTDEIRIGWFGSRGHLEDLKMITPALKEVLKKYPQARFVYSGFGGMSSDRSVTEIGWGEDVFKELPRDQREFVIGVPEYYWPMRHRFLDFDIGLCPLVDDEFNHNKVATKWLEYSALKTPSVCSPTVYQENPFGEGKPTVEDGKTGFIAKSTKDWVDAISKLVEDAKLRKSMGKAAYREVDKNWNIDKTWTNWIDAYEKVLAS